MPPEPREISSSVVARSRRGMPSRVADLTIPVVAIIGVVIVWAAIVRAFDIPDYLLPAPQAVVARLIKDWPLLWKNSLYTLISVMAQTAPGARGELLTTKGMAARLNVAPKTLLRWKAAGKVRPAQQLGQRGRAAIRWRGDEVAR